MYITIFFYSVLEFELILIKDDEHFSQRLRRNQDEERMNVHSFLSREVVPESSKDTQDK